MDFVINMRICLLVIANYVYRANCRQHHWHNHTTRGPRLNRRRGLLLRMRNCSRQANANAVSPQQKQDTALALSPNGLDLYFSAPLLSTYFLLHISFAMHHLATGLHERLYWTAKTPNMSIREPASAPRSRWFGGGGNALVGMFCTGLGKMRILSVWPLVRPSVGAHSKVVVIIIWWGHRVWKRKPQWLTRVCCVLMHTLQLQLNDGRGGVWRKRRRIILLFWKPLKAGNVG